MKMNFDGYQCDGFYDEMFLSDGGARAGAMLLKQKLPRTGQAQPLLQDW